MEFEWETSPLVMARHSRDWNEQPGPSSLSVAPSAFASTSSLSQRRRSSAVHMPPAVPPPNQPIPSVPASTRVSIENHEDDGGYFYESQNNGRASNFMNAYERPQASAKLAAVAAFSQSRHASPSINSLPRSTTSTAASSVDNLSDPPPRSILHTASTSRTPAQHQEIVPDRLLLSPPQPRPTEHRPSSRRALTRALELAREAVQLDATNDDPHGAVIAYGRSVALLSEVMERVRRGEDSTERRRNGRRRSVVAQEEEIRRLKSIHDTYADRMNILSVIYSIPPVPHSPSSVYTSTMSVSTDSTQPSSPSTTSPSSDTSDPLSLNRTNHLQTDFHQDEDVSDIGSDVIGTALYDIDALVDPTYRPGSSSKSSSPPTPPASYHPYAIAPRYNTDAPPVLSPTPALAPTSRSRSGSIVGRPRASSALPPPAPPPLTSPPPPPAPVILEPPVEIASSQVPNSASPALPTARHLDVAGRPRGNSTTHKRTGSGGRLAALQEENENNYHQIHENDQHRNTNRDSHPLPPIPSPSSGSTTTPETPRNEEPQSPLFVLKPRGTSILTIRADTGLPPPPPPLVSPPLINPSTNMGTISQRRSKTSAPPGTSSPPAENFVSTRLTASSLPASTATSLGIGRSRSSSQPGRRPSVVGGRISPMENRPPLPQTAGVNGSIVPRKASHPSKLNPNITPPQLVIQTELSPTGSVPATALIPPLPIAPGNLPTTPTSPLPPLPPNDALRKPYHMMNLLRTTMTVKSGGYVTRRLHVPQEVWSQGGAKLTNILEKVRVVEVLCSALEELQKCSVEYFGTGNVSNGMALDTGNIGKKEGDAWITKLEEFSSVCDGVVANFGKKLGVGEGFVLKKTTGMTSWGGKLTRQFDKFTNGKNLDSPAAYVAGLTRLFLHAQVLDEHTKALMSHPLSPAYASFSADMRGAVEVKLKRSSEFFASVVLTFVVRDLSQLLDKYAKKCEKWLAE